MDMGGCRDGVMLRGRMGGMFRDRQTDTDVWGWMDGQGQTAQGCKRKDR